MPDINEEAVRNEPLQTVQLAVEPAHRSYAITPGHAVSVTGDGFGYLLGVNGDMALFAREWSGVHEVALREVMYRSDERREWQPFAGDVRASFASVSSDYVRGEPREVRVLGRIGHEHFLIVSDNGSPEQVRQSSSKTGPALQFHVDPPSPVRVDAWGRVFPSPHTIPGAPE